MATFGDPSGKWPSGSNVTCGSTASVNDILADGFAAFTKCDTAGEVRLIMRPSLLP
jgi:hypothetical protein